MENRLATLRRLLRLQGSWLLVKLLGPDMISKEDLAELKKYKKLPSGDEVDLIGRAFSLGRLSAVMKRAEYSDLELEQLSRFDKFRNSSADKLAIREAKIHAASRIQAAVSRAMETASDGVSRSSTDLFSAITTREVLTDEVTIAVREKKSRQQLASSLGNKLKADLTRDIKRIAVTEFHRAKQRGIAMAIANKVDIYKESDGIESLVSVVPNRGACKDCKHLYLDDEGNPKVFVLKDLVARGSNADPGVSHTVGADGLRVGWKAVMPPAHPHCFCELTYMPPGMHWEQGKLVSDIKKAVHTGSLKPTIKPLGPPSKGPSLPKPGNVQGLAAKPKGLDITANASPGGQDATAPATPDAQQDQGGINEMVSCPYGGGEACRQHGGNGHHQHKVGGSVMQKHSEAEAAKGSSNPSEDPATQQISPEEFAKIIFRNDAWTYESHKPEETLNHLANSDLVRVEPLGSSAAKGINDSKKAYTKDNGPGILKSSFDGSGIDCRHEKAAYNLFTLAGSTRCAPTTTRMVTKDGQDKVHSFQAWNSDGFSAAKLYQMMNKGNKPASPSELVGFMLEKSKNKEQLIDHLSDIIVMDAVMCNTDRHMNNIMVNEDFSEAYAIDHGFSFGPGLGQFDHTFSEGFSGRNMHVRVSPEQRNWLEKVSFNDMKRAAGDIEEWRVAQSYLRSKFILYIMEESGGKFDTNELFNHKFEQFAIQFMDYHAENPDSPEHETAKYFRDQGVLMDPDDNMWGRKSAHTDRVVGKQYEYEMFVRADQYYKKAQAADPLLVVKYHNRVRELEKDVEAKYGDRMKKLGRELDDLQDKRRDLELEYISVKKELDKIANVLEGKAKGDYDAENHRELLFRLREVDSKRKEARKNAADAREHFQATDTMKQRALRQARRDAKVELFVPPGQEKLFAELKNKLEAARGNEIPKKAKTKPDYSKLRPKRSKNAAADIESRKRGT